MARQALTGSWRHGSVALAAFAACCLLAYWVGGYHTVRGDALGYGHYSLNLLGPVAPQVSGLLPSYASIVDGSGGQFEGFNYLGGGLLLLAALNLLARPRACMDDLRRNRGLAVTLLALLLVALSNRVFLGSWELLSLELPEPGAWLLGHVRASGRLFWPIAYVVIAWATVATLRNFRPRVALFALLIATVVQGVDVSPLHVKVAERAAVGNELYLPAATWRQLLSAHDRLSIYPSHDCAHGTWQLQLRELVLHAAALGVTASTSFSARRLPVNCVEEPAEALARARAPAAGELVVLLGPPYTWWQPFSSLKNEASCRSFVVGFACPGSRGRRGGSVLPSASELMPQRGRSNSRIAAPNTVELHGEDLASSPGIAFAPAEAALLRIERGHRPGYVMFGPGQWVPAGRIRTTVTAAFSGLEGLEARTHLCHVDVYGDGAVFSEGTIAVGDVVEGETRDFSLRFTLTRPVSSFELRVWCFGAADVVIQRALIAVE